MKVCASAAEIHCLREEVCGGESAADRGLQAPSGEQWAPEGEAGQL